MCGEGEEGAEAGARLDAYAAALDEVEGRLLQEIAARSPHFFEAAGVVQDLRGALARTFASVAGLRRQARPALADPVVYPCTARPHCSLLESRGSMRRPSKTLSVTIVSS